MQFIGKREMQYPCCCWCPQKLDLVSSDGRSSKCKAREEDTRRPLRRRLRCQRTAQLSKSPSTMRAGFDSVVALRQDQVQLQ